MDDQDVLARRFEQHRPHLRAVAQRMLGSVGDADDAVQEAWMRLARSDAAAIDNLGGWLTTVVARVCLDVLRARAARPALRSVDLDRAPVIAAGGPEVDPEEEAVLADSIGVALLVVLETLTPSERLAFVLHDMFAVPFDDIASIVGCSPAAARQFASRGRRRVQGGAGAVGGVDVGRQREVVVAFLAASRSGDFAGLLAVLAPDVVLRADAVAVAAGAPAELRGASAVAANLAGRAKAAQLATVDGTMGLVWAVGGRPKVVFHLTFRDSTIVGIDLVMDPADVEQSDVELLDA